MKLSAPVRPVDMARTYRLLLAWTDGDPLGLDAVLADANAEPAGLPALLFTLTEFAHGLATHGTNGGADLGDRLRTWLLAYETTDGPQG